MRTAVRLLAALALLADPSWAANRKSSVPSIPKSVTVPAVPSISATGLNLTQAAAQLTNVHAYGHHAYGAPTLPGQEQHAYGRKTEVPAGAAQAADPLAPVSEDLARTQDLSPSQAKQAADADWAPRVGEAGRPLEIVQVAAEAVPFIKTGGLADVLDGLSRELAAKGQRVTLVLPNYKNLKRDGLSLTKVKTVPVPVGGRLVNADILRAEKDGVEILLLDAPGFSDRDGPYAEAGKLHEDNDERFALLARGALEALRALGRKPDVIQAHDWHASLVAPMLKLLYHDEPAFAGTRSVVTIHNIAYQGDFDAASVAKAGFSMHDFSPDKLAQWGKLNYLKAGLRYADALTTVSPNYALETQTPAFGVGMEALLHARRKSYHGIINGLDAEAWSPSGAGMISQYGVDDVRAGKAAAKAFLQERFGLDVDPDKPLFAVLSRVDPQKGVDLVAANAALIDALGGQLFVLGGAAHEPSIDHLAQAMPGRFFRHSFDTVLPKLLMAAADFLLMPSRFEPCGLSQLQAMLMGTIPVVTPVGGLKDTVVDVRRKGGTGIVIARPDAASLARGLKRARRLYDDPQKLAQARRNGMTQDVTWNKPAESYLELFRRLVFGQPD